MPEQLAGICWPRGGTVGHITVRSALIRGVFPNREGDDALACCSLAPAGKYRNGASRAWCRTHQRYWGTKADLAERAASGMQRCASHAAPMGYIIDPPVLNMRDHASVSIIHDAAGIHIAAQPFSDATPPWRVTVAACAIACNLARPLFGDAAIVQVNVTPPALHSLAAARASGQAIGCVNCARCGHPHLDLGEFAARQHRRHYCGNCGHDATHSTHALISNPLLALLSSYEGLLHIADSNVQGLTVL